MLTHRVHRSRLRNGQGLQNRTHCGAKPHQSPPSTKAQLRRSVHAHEVRRIRLRDCSGLPHHSRVPSRNIIRHHVIFTTNCTCEPFNKHACPRYLSLPRRPHVSSFLFTNAVSHFVRIGCSDLHELISPRLPNELYFLLCQGGILPQVVNNLLSGALLEAPPLVPARQGVQYPLDANSPQCALVW